MRLRSLLLLLATTSLAACGASSSEVAPADGEGGAAGAGGEAGGAGAGGAAGAGSTAAIRIIVEPDGVKPNEIATAIRAAKRSVHMTMYLLTSTEVSDALVSQHQAGVDVKVVLNQTFPQASTSNATSYQKLQSAGVPVTWGSSEFTYTHEKALVIDAATAWIMTMNATVTSSSQNREYLAVDEEPAHVAEAEALFAADFTHGAFTPQGELLVAPLNARERLVALIGSATRTLDVEGEEFSDTSIANALVARAKAGVAVRLVLATGSPPTSQQKAITSVKQAGVSVVATATPFIHSKAIVVDGARAYVGSENFTTGSLSYNRELGVIVEVPSEVAKVASAIETDFQHGTAQ